MHSDDLAACQDNEGHPAVKVVMLAAWTAALADAANQTAFAGGDSDDEEKEPLGLQLAAMIKDADPECPAPGEEDYDPIRAATLLAGSQLVVFDEQDDVP